MRILRKWKVFLVAVMIAIVLIQWVIPAALLKLSHPEAYSKGKASNELSHYIDTYEQSRSRFLSYPERLKNSWEQVRHESYEVGSTKLNMDVLWADANNNKENLIVLTSGVHGIEAHMGSAMIDLFQAEYLSQLDPQTTGVIYIHAINPWGMKHFRRYNENNVDLNRNFIPDWDSFSLNTNKDYTDLRRFFEKDSPLRNSTLHEIGFFGSLGKEVIASGTGKIEKALLTGQYSSPEGVYYGGSSDEPSTVIVKKIYEEILKSDYPNIVHIDLHTGYGPKYQMSIFASSSETMKEAEAEKEFDYPLVFTPDSDEYYVTSGDNTEYMYWLQKEKHPGKKVYSTTFEFGTMGTSTMASIQSLKNTIDENRLFQDGTNNKTTGKIIKNRYLQMFYPSEEKWRVKAAKDFRQALEGVLKNRGVPLRET
ncbi:M14 family metallopeptidase [Bacillus sp. T33-2]|uniref:M14 family metallopeptidase n=1 Tax=Bacillus sp. T33-2 TaxID=2054168 RepID=UPI000C76F205|nr:M14 family metallopeptidase [Bacillus sp. T33-2]PLR92830.1 hypothetical protein CVD19_19740 [Bacillus sp. T33-2]